jgi:hypothetical protein
MAMIMQPSQKIAIPKSDKRYLKYSSRVNFGGGGKSFIGMNILGS